MGEECDTYGTKRHVHDFLGKLTDKDNSEEKGIYGNILKWISNKMVGWRELDSSGSA